MTSGNGKSPEQRGRALFVLGSIPLFGLELANIEVARSMQARGWEVLMLTNEHWGHVSVNPRLDQLGIRRAAAIFFGKMERGARFSRWLVALRLQVTENWKLFGLLRKFRPDVIHLGVLEDFIAFLPVLMLWRGRLVFQAGTEPDASHPLLRIAWRWFLFPRVSSLVVVSSFLRSRFLALGAPPARTSVIYNPVPVRPPTDTSVPIPSTSRFLFVGQISERKGVELLVDACLELFARRSDGELVLVGAASSDLVSRLASRIELAGLSKRIRFMGYAEDPGAWYRACSVHVCPSLVNEAFGIVVAEAKTAGVPSIVSDRGALPELVTDGVDGFVCAHIDATAIARALSRFLDEPGLAQRLGEAARASIARLGIDSVDEQWQRVFGA